MNNQHSYLLCEIYSNRHISAITREARCVNRRTILVWKLLRCYPKLKVNIAPREINRLFLPQGTEIGVIVNPICPFFCQVSHHLPILHEGWSFCWKFRSIYSNKYLESRSPGVLKRILVLFSRVTTLYRYLPLKRIRSLSCCFKK